MSQVWNISLGSISRKDSPNPWVLFWQMSKVQQQSFKNHQQSNKSSKINNNHQTPSNIKKKTSFLGGDFSHTQLFPLPGRSLSESLAPGQVKIAHGSWRWIEIGWYLEFGVWLLIFMFFISVFCVVYVWCGENVLLFCLFSFGHWASFGMISHQRCEE